MEQYIQTQNIPVPVFFFITSTSSVKKIKKEQRQKKEERKCANYTNESFVTTYPVKADAITFILKETARISKCSK